jgi:hypothetical protein
MGPRRLLTARPDARPGVPPLPTRHRRNGMTVVEMLVVVVMLATAMLAMAQFMAGFAHATKTSAVRARSLDLVTDRIDSVEHAPTYVSIDSMAATEMVNADSSIYTRVTTVQHVGGAPTDTLDYRVVTVNVTPGGGVASARKTIVIGAF